MMADEATKSGSAAANPVDRQNRHGTPADERGLREPVPWLATFSHGPSSLTVRTMETSMLILDLASDSVNDSL